LQAFGLPGATTLGRPQLLESVDGSTQRAAAPVPQVTDVAVAAQRHWPPMQVVPLPQATPQAPQLALSVFMLVQAGPVAEGHTVWPPAQTHVPPLQLCPAASHCVPQAPQFDGLLPRITSQPFVTSPSQFAVPGEQTRVHRPALQKPMVVLGRPTQLLPQEPQFASSLLMSMQRAAAPVPQLSWPVGQAHTPATQL